MHSEFEDIWNKIIANAGQSFTQLRGEQFTYSVSGTGGSIALSRTNQNVGRATFESAWLRRPLSRPGALSDLRAPSYLFAILTDPRVAG